MCLNILVAMPQDDIRDSFIPREVASVLESLGNVRWNTSTEQFNNKELGKALAGMDVCITGWGCPRFDHDVLYDADSLRLIVHTGGTVAPIVSDFLYDAGIKVISGNKLYAELVAEGTVAYMLCSLRNIPYYCNDMRSGGWQTDGYNSESLLDQTVGLVGFGAIAKYLVRLLAPFRAAVKAYDPLIPEDVFSEYGVWKSSLEEIFSTCKIISIHAPLIPDTYHMIGRELLERIPDGSVLINTARGAIIDEAALVEELEKGRFKAVLDVFEEEPLPACSRLRKLDNAMLIPHMAGPTFDRRKLITLALIEDIKRYFSNKPLEYEIDREYAMGMTGSQRASS
jgi:phosphoglycerate dehydrogenase-like enzyme